MSDLIAEVIALLRPGAPFSKLVGASGAWRVRRTEVGQVYYATILAGSVRLVADGHAAVLLDPGDFVLIPAAYDFAMESTAPPPDDRLETLPIVQPDGSVRLGRGYSDPDVQMLVGYCTFGSSDASLLTSLLPDMAVVRGENRLSVLAQLLRDEVRASRPARDVIVGYLLQLLLIEALRSTADTNPPPGLLRGLRDPRLASALRAIHGAPDRSWTVADLAARAGMSRSAFFSRFSEAVGVAPMEYLMNWRMVLAKNLLEGGATSIAEIAVRVGYGSTSAFSTAFARRVGHPPARYAQQAGRSRA